MADDEPISTPAATPTPAALNPTSILEDIRDHLTTAAAKLKIAGEHLEAEVAPEVSALLQAIEGPLSLGLEHLESVLVRTVTTDARKAARLIYVEVARKLPEIAAAGEVAIHEATAALFAISAREALAASAAAIAKGATVAAPTAAAVSL